jgi:hypothetical protein
MKVSNVILVKSAQSGPTGLNTLLVPQHVQLGQPLEIEYVKMGTIVQENR